MNMQLFLKPRVKNHLSVEMSFNSNKKTFFIKEIQKMQ